MVDPEYVKDRRVYVHLLCAFRHGREDNDFLGVSCHKDLFLNTKQVFPPICLGSENGTPKITRLQERLIRKLGPDTYPFSFKVRAFFYVLDFIIIFFIQLYRLPIQCSFKVNQLVSSAIKPASCCKTTTRTKNSCPTSSFMNLIIF